MLNKVFCDEFKHVCCDGKQWACKTCDSALTRGNMPLQAQANGLQLQPIPPELSSRNACIGVKTNVAKNSVYENGGSSLSVAFMGQLLMYYQNLILYLYIITTITVTK